MDREKALEVLAPAGSIESMKAAVAAGADAVYMGGSRFGARAYADNPDEDGLLKAIDYIHLHGRRLYLTVNTLFREEEMEDLYSYLLPYYREGLDAAIVQDLGAMSFIRQQFPGLDIPASTQMTITGSYGAKLLKELGAVRVVTARELSLEEIRKIHDQVDVEIESVVHGALGYCYSGQCLMSSLIGGRSGNRGRCAQPCRLPYEAREWGGRVPVNSQQERYLLSLKDLCTLDLIPEMVRAGVYSMKIEGRMKSPRYTAGVVRIYRKYADRYLEYGSKGYQVDPEDKRELADLFDRGGFTKGYYKQHNGKDMIAVKEKPAFRKANQELFDRLDRLYVHGQVKEPIEGRAELKEGLPARLTLSSSLSQTHGTVRPVQVCVEGPCPMEAMNQPAIFPLKKRRASLGNQEKKICLLSENSGHFWKSPVSWGLLWQTRVSAVFIWMQEDFRRIPGRKMWRNAYRRKKNVIWRFLIFSVQRGKAFLKQMRPSCGKRDSRAFWFGIWKSFSG